MLSIAVVGLALINAGLAVFVLLRNTRNQQNLIFWAFATLICIWMLANYFGSVVTNPVLATWLVKTDFAFGLQLACTFLIFSNTVGRRQFSNSLVSLASLPFSLLVGIGVYFDKVVKITKVAGGVQTGSEAFFWLYEVLILIFIVGGIAVLITKSIRFKGPVRNQVSTMLYGLALAAILIVGTNLILPEFVKSIAIQNYFQRFSYLGLAFFNVMCAYAIVKHRLFDIRLLVARSIAYTLLLASLAGMFTVAAFGVTNLFFKSNDVSSTQKFVYAALAIILAFTFQPLRRFFEKITDRVFYRDRYDSQTVLNGIGKTLAEEIKLEPLLRKTLAAICQSLRIGVGQFMIFENNRVYKVEHFGPVPHKLMTVPTMQKLRQSILVADELEGGERKQILDDHGVRVSLMLRTRDEFVGYLFLGDKLSGDIYSDQDLRLLEILAQELSIAISNATAYEEIAQFNITLQEKVEHATARLRVANRNLKALDKAKDEFLSMASHQLRTPLTTIKGYLSMILEGDVGQTTPEQKEFLDYAFDGAERMVALISDLLNVSRLAAGRFVIERKPTDLVAVTADEVRQLQSHADAKSLELKFTPPATPMPLINIDENKTRQVIMNFIDNAVYYTKTGGVYVSLEQKDSNVELKVRDTGIGVPEEAKKKLFTKFYRAGNAQIARPDGTGLGIYLAKRVVEDQGGTVIFESTEGHGSTFGFSIPMK